MTEHRIVTVSGQLPKIKESSLRRLAVYVVSGREVLSASPVTGAGTFQLHVVHALVAHDGASAVLGPKGLDPQALLQRTDLPRLALSSAKSAGHNAYTLDVSALNVSDRLIDPWWIWCREYKVSGTLQTGGDCPVGALVTVYNVTSGVSGLIATPIETVPTGPDGSFTASFNWCSRLCWWPCWPIWWQCWPWWWERDILAVIENIERQIDRTDFANAKPRAFASAPLGQPSPADLMIGAGFSGARSGALQPDSARTALIASKFANPRIRDLFPWWWWCCDNPNILFSAAQGTVTVLDEDPNVSTRWCFASGQTVSLTANSQAVGACQVQTGGPCGFAWSSVGDEPGGVLVSDISSGYANGTFGTAASNAAFTGTLNLNGLFSGDCAAFYQVLAGQWGGGGPGILTAGNPARGGTPPTSSPPLSVPLYDTITIWSGGVPAQVSVYLGPCSFGGVDTLYVTRAFRQNPPAGVTGLPPFPAVGGDLWGWDAPNLVLSVPAATLANPATGAGGVTLTVVPYDHTGTQLPTASQPFTAGPDLTLMIDTTPFTTATIDWNPGAGLSGVFNADHTQASVQTPPGSNCPAYLITTPGGGYVQIHSTVIDAAGHIYEYLIRTEYGSGTTLTASPADRNYAQAPGTFTLPSGSAACPNGVDPSYSPPNDLPPPVSATNMPWSFVGGGDAACIPITQSCCYDFQLWGGKRVTDGQTFFCTWGEITFQTVNITVASAA